MIAMFNEGENAIDEEYDVQQNSCLPHDMFCLQSNARRKLC